MPSILCLLVLMPLAPVTGDGAELVTASVLFYYGPEEYYWDDSITNRSADAIAMSMAAANAINRGFVYDEATGAVEIGGLGPGGNDTWKWSLLSWDAGGERWVQWTGNPHDLKPQANGAIAWSPNDTANPTPNPLSRYPWPMFRCSASRRGETLSPAPLTNLTYWKTGLGIAVRSGPCVAGGRVFVLGEGGALEPALLFGLDEPTGRILWKTELCVSEGAGIEYGSPSYSDGRLLVGTGDGKFWALNARTGAEEWNFTAADSAFGTISSPAVAGGRVLFSTGEGAVHCLGMDGRPVWKTNVSGPIAPYPCAPAVLGDKVVVGTQEGRLLCLALGNGSVIWNVSLEKEIVTTPALSAEGYAFVLASAGLASAPGNMTLYSFILRDGVQQWNATYPRSMSSPAYSAGGLFLGTGTGMVGHHPDRGVKFWGVPVGPVDASPAVARGYVYFATNTPVGVIGCVGVSGNVMWTLTTGEPVFASPVVADGKLFVATVNGTVWCLGRPPEPRLGARLVAPAKASENEKVDVKATLNNTGEAPGLFTVFLTVDGNRTELRKGPFELQPGERMNVSFEWKAEKGNHTLGISFNGTNATFSPAPITVGPASNSCSSVIWTAALAGSALLVPSVVKWKRRRRP